MIQKDEIKKPAAWVIDHLPDLKNKKVLVVGDVGLDVYLMGEVKRLSPEAPVPILDVQKEDTRLGLAANVAQNIQTLGGQCHLISVVGKDQAADDLKALLKKQGVVSADLIADSERPTTRKMRLLTGQHHLARVDFEKQHLLSEKIKAETIQKISQAILNVDIVILQDYSKGMIDAELAQQLIQKCNALGKKVLVDPYRSTLLSTYKGAYLMTPNKDESLALARQIQINITDSPEAVDVIGKTLMNAIGSQQMVVTLGAQGMKLFEKGQTQQLPTFAQNVFDVTGAGDTVIAAMALALAAGWDLEKAGYLANFAAGVVVGKVGCVPCEIKELVEFIQRH
jgi:D-glycero-beta-D-manno-heptose-7-phosphate kinase